MSKIHILAVHLDSFFWKSYLYLFDQATCAKILQQHPKKQLQAFASALLKQYYLLYFFDIPRDQLKISYNLYGKPYVSLNEGYVNKKLTICFNIAHSGDYVIIVIGQHYELGVDLERVRPTKLVDNPKLLFSPEEKWLIMNCSGDKLVNFFKMWTKKESYIKALGTGMNLRKYIMESRLSLDPIEKEENYLIISMDISRHLHSITDQYWFALCMFV